MIREAIDLVYKDRDIADHKFISSCLSQLIYIHLLFVSFAQQLLPTFQSTV